MTDGATLKRYKRTPVHRHNNHEGRQRTRDGLVERLEKRGGLDLIAGVGQSLLALLFSLRFLLA